MIKNDELKHYGIKRRSGRYPWGSGEDGYQHESGFLADIDDYRAKGLSDKEIARELGISTSTLRSRISIANEERKAALSDKIASMKADGMTNAEIHRKTGIPESTIRNYISNKDIVKAKQIHSTTQELKDLMKETPYLDVGVGTEQHLGISRTKLKSSIEKLKEEGYYEHDIYVRRLTDKDKWTTVHVLTKEPDIEIVKQHRDEIRLPEAWSEDGGLTYSKLKPIENVDWDRVMIRYGDEHGVDRDGLIQMRRNVDDLDLGSSRYAQVRIGLNGTHYMKGMAMYSDDMPDGVDLIFNTNKPKGTPKEKVFKKQKDSKDNPFGTTINRQKGALNIVNEEGDWDGWSGNKWSAQFLSKQPTSLVKERLQATYSSLAKEYDGLSKLTNPIVKKHLLESYADGLESKEQHLKVLGLPRSKGHVLLPFPEMKENEVYAPNYRNGEKVVLIRYPHGGTFEIPELTVNNKGKAKKVLGNATDAIGINPKVAHKLSGADFDGDAVYVIPNNSKKIRATSSLKGLEKFDPNSYSVGHKTISPRQKQTQMGIVSNLITDMTIKGASTSELTRAVRHSMVVIDSEKHQLDWKQSAKDNAIAALQKKYQSWTDSKGKKHIGASTLISRSKKKKQTPATEVKVVDKKTGKVSTRVKRGKTESLMLKTKDARTLSSGTEVENAYASYVNNLKKLESKARSEANHIRPIVRNKEASKSYSKQVKSLETKVNTAIANAPRERRAQLLASSYYYKNRTEDMSPDQLKKLKSAALANGRATAKANKTVVNITPKEWEAIQAGAISNNMLEKVLNNADMTKVQELATPHTRTAMPSAKVARAKSLLGRGYTYAEVAQSLGVSTSTLSRAVRE